MQSTIFARTSWLALCAGAALLSGCNSSSSAPAAAASSEEPQTAVAPPVSADVNAPQSDVIAEAARTAKLAEIADPEQQEAMRTASIAPNGPCQKTGQNYKCPVAITMELESGAANQNYTVEMVRTADGKWVSAK